jgi:hypothetical protein
MCNSHLISPVRLHVVHAYQKSKIWNWFQSQLIEVDAQSTESFFLADREKNARDQMIVRTIKTHRKICVIGAFCEANGHRCDAIISILSRNKEEKSKSQKEDKQQGFEIFWFARKT